MTERALTVRNRQKGAKINLSLLRKIAASLLSEELRIPAYEISLQLVDTTRITRINEQFLQHRGPTDVITFDYSKAEPVSSPGASLPLSPMVGDIVICVDEALKQARRFGIPWQTELVRYVIHGVLHLLGFKDATTKLRRRMKSREDALLRAMTERFTIAKLAADAPLLARKARSASA